MLKVFSSKLALLFALFNLLLASSSFAAEEAKAEEEQKEPVMYYMITPNLMTFYQNSGRKMGYVVVQVQVVVRGQDNFDLLDLHLPLLQDALTDHFNRQDKAVITDLKQRETLRQQTTEILAKVIKEEVGKDVVENVLFTSYIFQ
jgi:flagellar protein FliL